MKIQDYIKDGEGQRVYINRKGMQLANKAIAISGGGKKFAEEIGVHENTIVNFRRDAYCSMETFEAIFNAMQKQIA